MKYQHKAKRFTDRGNARSTLSAYSATSPDVNASCEFKSNSRSPCKSRCLTLSPSKSLYSLTCCQRPILSCNCWRRHLNFPAHIPQLDHKFYHKHVISIRSNWLPHLHQTPPFCKPLSVFIIFVVSLAFRLHPDPTVTTKIFYL